MSLDPSDVAVPYVLQVTDPITGVSRDVYINVRDYSGPGDISISESELASRYQDTLNDPVEAAKFFKRLEFAGTQLGETSGKPLDILINWGDGGPDVQKGSGWLQPNTISGQTELTLTVDVNWFARTNRETVAGPQDNNSSEFFGHENDHLYDYEAGVLDYARYNSAKTNPYYDPDYKWAVEKKAVAVGDDQRQRQGLDPRVPLEREEIDRNPADLNDDDIITLDELRQYNSGLVKPDPESNEPPLSWGGPDSNQLAKAYAAGMAQVRAQGRNTVTPDDTSGHDSDSFDEGIKKQADGGVGEDLNEIAEALRQAMLDAISRSSPLVFDIDDSGTIDLSAFADTNTTYFDLDNDGFAERTGWVDATDGILVYDQNEDGRIKGTGEWFGNSETDGFSILSSHDSNDDGAITAEDVIWSSLRIWQDTDQDGVANLYELHTLDELDITSISIEGTEVSLSNDGHLISHTGTFVVDDGVSSPDSRIIHDVWFTYDQTASIYEQDFTLDMATAYLPTHRGYGNLADLHVSASLDNTGSGNLLQLVDELNDLTFSALFDDTSATVDAIKAIMFRWAGVHELTGDERGPFVDSRELGFLEKMSGIDFLQRGVHQNPYGSQAGEDINEAFHLALNHIFANLAAQAAGGQLFEGDFYYSVMRDAFVGIEGLNTTTLDALETEATGLANTAAREVFWSNVLRMIEFTVGVDNLPGGDQTALNDAIEASDSALDLEDLIDGLAYVRDIGVIENGTSGNDTKNGSSADDSFDGLAGDDTLYGNAGNDTLDGGADNDILDGGTGGDFLDGGNGNDTFVYDLGDGEDTIIEGGGTDEILMGAGIDAGDITLSRAGAEDLVIDIDTGSQTGRIVIENHFTTNGVVEQIEFSDTSTLALTTQNWTITGTSGNDYLYGVKAGGGTTDTIYGGAGHDVIYGYTGDDTLYGEDGNDAIYGHTGSGSSTTDTMYGGNGNDYIEGSSAIDIIHDGAGDDIAVGGSGNDEYHYTSGHDTYEDSNGTDEIFLPTGFSSAGTVYYKIGNTLQIVLDASNSITIPDYYAGTQYRIETLDFFSDPDVDLTTVSTITQGGTGNDTLNGTNGNDTFYGNGGHDTLYGDDGNDTLYGGIGNDALYGQDDNDIVDGGAGDDYVAGGYGADSYVYVSGHDIYTEVTSGSSTDKILMGADWTLEDLKFERHQIALNSLLDAVITINGTNSITIKSMFSQSSNLIETIEFMDTSTISMSAQQFTTYGSSSNDVINGISVNGSTADIIYGNAGLDNIDGGNGNDIIYGGDDHDELYGGNNDDELYGDAGNDYIEGENGNDTLRGGAGDDVLVGYDGNDLYIYDSGLDTITETLNDTDTLWIAGGRTINDMTIANYGTDEAKITITASVDEIIVYNLRGSASQRVEYITFDDGFTTTLPDYAGWLSGSSGNDLSAGNSSDNTIIGFAGDDTITGAGGADKAHGGAGEDSLDGGDGADLLYGGDDDDILYGKAGLDTMHGGDGADTFVFETASAFSDIDVIRDFSVTDADVLDLTDILDTVYDPMTDAIADFVAFTESSGSTFVSVDRDGTGGTYSMAQIIKLENVTGLASPDTLETNGNLLAA